ncbi:zinc-binding dehydrogenase [Pseudonocardia sp. KRD291]|uniref:zinc-dependent alcohol dehydrogenase n=1 Tax=Pseudonocardia sp. KRD291 TaxID=2792007 RepID=UPI001C4A71DD|nr:alcohol dehydrogenase catalytic domain-containing protein [Pseudonocardia sp. KRD291]MBW0101089.1 alcohol dehydrogenase catalytic domain-containing protein [Pseudonocardia sp. KRD291]
MRAAITTASREVAVRDLEPPGAPRPGEVLLRPLAVGICGSDVHLYDGDDAALSGSARGLPRVQGHEIGAEVMHDPSGRLAVGERVAVWPLLSCGSCHMCAAGAVNACLELSIIGVHRDGGLAEQIMVPGSQVVRLGAVSDVVAALVEPLSVGVHAVARSGVGEGDRAVVFGGGAVGQGICLALADRGADVLLVDPARARAEAGALWGASTTTDTDRERLRERVLDRTDGRGADAVLEATGIPAVLDTALDVVRVGGTVVVVGLGSASGPVHPGTIAAKELRILGSSCCTGEEFALAAEMAGRWATELDRLPVLRHPLEGSGGALATAHHAPDVVKVLVDVAVPSTVEPRPEESV